MKKRKILIMLLLVLSIILFHSCSFMDAVTDDPYVQDAWRDAWKATYGTEYPY